MKYSLRSLMIAAILGPALLAAVYWIVAGMVLLLQSLK
jgi:hypothetical protein